MQKHRLLFIFMIISINIFGKDFYIRVNQLGFLPQDYKSAVVISKTDLSGKSFEVIEVKSQKVFIKGIIGENLRKLGNFNFSYKIDFSRLSKIGKYEIKIEKEHSLSFLISYKCYNEVTYKLLKFFEVQRCGYTNPHGHKTCHIADCTSMIDENGKEIGKQIDLTGGWHDAGDYVKFLNTTAYTVYTMLFAYEFEPQKFGFDKNKNGVPDILEEAKIGLDWLIRCNFEKYKLISGVQGLQDHNIGWRMPENDSLQFNRPAYIGIGKNTVGIYTAVMAMAARIWRNVVHYNEFADKCLTIAENIYSIRCKVPDIDSSGCGMYIDKHYKGKLALGAIELYQTTKRTELLAEAAKLAEEAGADYWWSWGNINSYSHYKLAKIYPEYSNYIRQNLEAFSKTMEHNLFGEATSYTWGTTNTLLGVSLQAILFKDITGDNSFDKLAEVQRDYILGRNQWGISFIYKIGKSYSRNLHHQVLYFNRRGFEGGFAAGPISRKVLDNYKIPFANKYDKLEEFQTEEAVYRDDRMDYVTNEPTITANATALFVMGYYSIKE